MADVLAPFGDPVPNASRKMEMIEPPLYITRQSSIADFAFNAAFSDI